MSDHILEFERVNQNACWNLGKDILCTHIDPCNWDLHTWGAKMGRVVNLSCIMFNIGLLECIYWYSLMNILVMWIYMWPVCICACIWNLLYVIIYSMLNCINL